MYWHYLVNLSQRSIDKGLVLFFDIAPHFHLLQVLSWYQLLKLNKMRLLKVTQMLLQVELRLVYLFVFFPV